ncbi:MAG: endolytic transglycosylase MltG [Patescibacteria group bacterium]|nr:endolytic transglycosylase MltG [Patescibacteria group bacterium]
MDIIKKAISKNNISVNKPSKYLTQKNYHLFRIAIIVIASILLLVGIFFSRQFYKSNSKISKFVEFNVERGESVSLMAKKLHDQNLISNEFYFKTYIFLKRANKKVNPGKYELNQKMSIADIAGMVTGNKSSQQQKIVIIEGWNSKQIADYLADLYAKNNASKNVKYDELKNDFQEKFLAEVNNPQKYNYDFLADKPKDASLEGYLYPDTYFVYVDSNPETIIRKMLDNFVQKVTKKIIEQAKNQNMSLYEVLTLASIIQKEVKTPEEMKLAAGLYFNRLKADKALESDSTITYFTGNYDSRASAKDLQIKSPYNTYTHKGLPPGPISNPSLIAIEAVLNPTESDYMYFITDKNGKAIFSETGQEHVENVEEHLNQ